MTKRKSDDFSDQLSQGILNTEFESNEWNQFGKQTQPSPPNHSNEYESLSEKKIRKVIEATLDEEIIYKKFELEKINEVPFKNKKKTSNKSHKLNTLFFFISKSEYSKPKTCWTNFACA